MSVFFGYFNRKGGIVNKKIVNTMYEAISYWKPDDHDILINGSIVFGHSMLWNTPESKYEHLPLEKDIYILTMDARIDNRKELVEELELPDRPLEEIGDSEFILSAYKKWGEDCPKHLLGDFAFAIWDKQRNQLFCARDHVGIRLFYFYLSDELFIFSNDIEVLLKNKNIPKCYDERTIAMFFKDQGITRNRSTFFEKIKKLPPATTLTIKEKTVVEKKYWYIEDCPSIIYATYDEYVHQLKNLLDSSVDSRLRSSYSIVSHLSGGIDSSPLAVIAARKLAQKHQPLYAFNWIDVPDNNIDYEYESWNFSRRIVEKENIIHCEFNGIDSEFKVKQYDEHNILTKGDTFTWEEYFIQNEVSKIGARTILSGWGGDELISYNGSSYISALFMKGKLIQALQCLYIEKKKEHYSWFRFIKRLIRATIYPFYYTYFNKKNKDYGKREDYIYLKDSFVKFMKSYGTKEFSVKFGVRKNQLELYNYGHLQSRIESWALSAFSKKIEYSYPLLDRRIIEFAMGIPEEIFFIREGHRRHLMKTAITDFLPHDIIWFSKYDEVKVNKTLKISYRNALNLWYKKHKHDNCFLYENEYVDYQKILDELENFDFNNSDPYKLGKIILAILLSRAISELKKNDF